MGEMLLYDLFQAYYDARRNKRNTHSQLEFELYYENNLVKLYNDLITQKYIIGVSICFLICDTVPREIFAASFRDRVVHHLLYNYIYTTCDKQFIHDSYSCRIGKGTHYGVKRVDHFIRSCTKNYTQDAYILKLDIQGFFMNIDKERLRYLLWHMIHPLKSSNPLDKHRSTLHHTYPHVFQACLWRLIKQILSHDPTKDYVFRGTRDLYEVLPKDKSLFSSYTGVGLPIGNLTSQLFANVYLHVFDVRMKQSLGCEYYGRYVDDFIIIHHDKEFLGQCIPKIREYLHRELGLTLHPKKIYLQHYTKGVKFLGAYIKPHRIYINRRTISHAIKSFDAIASSAKQYNNNRKSHQKNLQKNEGGNHKKDLATINSYLGMMQHRKNYTKRKELCDIVSHIYSANENYTKCMKILNK